MQNCALKLDVYRSLKRSKTYPDPVLSPRIGSCYIFLWRSQYMHRSERTCKNQILLHRLDITSWGLYYKNFYGSNCCRIVISQNVCDFLSLPPWPNICGEDQEPAIRADSSMGLYSGMMESCPQILDCGGSDRKWQTLQLITIWQQLLP